MPWSGPVGGQREAETMTGDGLAPRWQWPLDLTRASGATPGFTAGPPTMATTAMTECGARNRLLARRYGRSNLAREDEARLEILSARVRAVMRRVYEEDLAALESTAGQVERSRKLRTQIEGGMPCDVSEPRGERALPGAS